MSNHGSLKPVVRDYALTDQPDQPAVVMKHADQAEELDGSSSPRKRLSRAVGKSVDNLTRSLISGSGRSTPQQQRQTAASPPPSPRRLFSLSRKGKPKESYHTSVPPDSENPTVQGRYVSQSPSSRPTSPIISGMNDDSPFIRPQSPSVPVHPTRPSLQAFRGDGSMRAGTQTLIQALQAIPWAEDPDNDDEAMHHGLSTSLESDSSDEEDALGHLASSIHTIHRPVARSRRADAPPSPALHLQTPGIGIHEEVESETEENLVSEEELETEDFERTPRPSSSIPEYVEKLTSSPVGIPAGSNVLPRRGVMVRSGSMATVRLQRRTKLAEKLKDVFELKDIDEVWAEMPCWLLRSVLLQGYMYLTNSHLCFFAHMPAREDQILKSGSLNKKAQRTKRWIKHWFVLKNDALSWYQSSSDPYFPHGIVDLRYAISCDPVNEKGIRLRTNQKTISLSADSVPSRGEWVKAIRRVIFKAQNMGDSVKIAIPYSVVLDVEKSAAMDFSETIEVRVVDGEEAFSVDSYFFAYFHDLPDALDQIRDAVRASRMLPPLSSPQAVLDTTAARPLLAPVVPIDRAQSLSTPDLASKTPSGFRLTSLLRPFHDNVRPMSSLGPERSDQGEDFTHISKRSGASFVPFTSSPKSQEARLPSEPRPSIEASASDMTPTPSNIEHTYPPSTPTNDLPSTSSWNVGVPSWLKGSSRRVLGSSSGAGIAYSTPLVASTSLGGISEVYSSTTLSSSMTRSRYAPSELGYSVLETPDMAIDQEMTDKFRTTFAFDDKETLLGYFVGYIYSLLPVYGRLFISTNYFCFKSSGPLTSRTRMMLPIRDILAVENTRATRFGHHGLIVIIKGHEELFFEFSLDDRRSAFVILLERQMEVIQRPQATSDPVLSPGKRDALLLEEFEAKTSDSTDADPRPAPDSMTDSLPAIMFTSASSTFLTFKPKESLHFTFLTIGSRGDVQPYIALAKALLADGHRVKIATHGEFKEWIESHGIEYGYVGGDPAELMRICVENGTFTLSFMKEGLLKFRGWLDDLLATSWEACQGTDVLIESPSAMGGYHIAEALGIPYFRAFTMTWSRTRAYPHAFAVPERKMGGSYNYMSYVMFDQVFWRATSGQINRWRRNVLHIASTSLDKMEPHKIPFLYNFSPVVVPPPLDWPEWIRITGYWFLDDAEVGSKRWTPPSDLEKFIDSAHEVGKKVVYIGFGSIVVSEPKAMTRTIVEAIVQSGVHAVLSKGWSDRLQAKTNGEVTEPEEPLPSQIFKVSSVPHDWLFRRIDAACHHGGAGTTGASLRAGIPTIIKPFFGDQFFWADRVEALGVGSGVRKLTVESLTDALRAATTDSKQIDRAKLVGEQIRAENGPATAAEAIYRDLEYARSLIKRAAHDDLLELENVIVDEDATIRDCERRPSSSHSGYSSSGSGPGASSEDWSVISDQEDRRSSMGSRRSRSDGPVDRPSTFKRNSLAAAVMSVLPDALHAMPSHRRSGSVTSSTP